MDEGERPQEADPEERLAQEQRERVLSKDGERLQEDALSQLFEENDGLREENEQEKERADREREKAEHDHFLTNLLNRDGFERAFTALRQKGTSGTLLLLDIDNFKQINDTLGHPAGDDTLMNAANRLKGRCRPTDLIARWGGEEFLLFFPDTTPEQVSEKFMSPEFGKAVINIKFTRHDDPAIEITFSGGITNLDIGEDLDAALKRADKALYEVKESGRNALAIAQKEVPQLDESSLL